MGTAATHRPKDYVHPGKIKGRMKPGCASQHSVQHLLPYHLIGKNVNITNWQFYILRCTCLKMVSHTKGVTLDGSV